MSYRSLAFLVLFLAGPLHGEPLTRQQTSYYYIEGRSALLLTEQMNQKGPVGTDGERHPARTKWEVQWKFRHNMHEGVCKMEDVAVAVGVNTIQPRWREEKTGPAELRRRWQNLMQAVERNRAFHKQQAVHAGQEIELALRELPPAKNCEELTTQANETASKLLEKYKTASDEHDRKTAYGRKDGASLI
jgi:predicted secreted Zn-dependent protease